MQQYDTHIKSCWTHKHKIVITKIVEISSFVHQQISVIKIIEYPFESYIPL